MESTEPKKKSKAKPKAAKSPNKEPKPPKPKIDKGDKSGKIGKQPKPKAGAIFKELCDSDACFAELKTCSESYQLVLDQLVSDVRGLTDNVKELMAGTSVHEEKVLSLVDDVKELRTATTKHETHASKLTLRVATFEVHSDAMLRSLDEIVQKHSANKRSRSEGHRGVGYM